MHIVDRRLNPGGKSLPNRQRFLRRVKDVAQRAVRESAREKDIKDLGKDGRVSVPSMACASPGSPASPAPACRTTSCRATRPTWKATRSSGPRRRWRPRLRRGRRGGENSEDAFRFVLTREEFLELFLEDLELPDLAKRRLAVVETEGLRRAGYTVTGSPANLALTRTLRNSMSRRIALKRPKPEEVAALEAQLAAMRESDPAGPTSSRPCSLRERAKRIPYVDPIDLRFRRFEPYPRPIAQAVMFCLMDVSRLDDRAHEGPRQAVSTSCCTSS